MEAGNDMALAFEKLVTPAVSRPILPGPGKSAAGLNIDVIFTSIETTLAALRQAGTLAHKLGARITLVVPQVVPYPLPSPARLCCAIGTNDDFA